MTPPESDLVNILGAPAGSFDSTGARATGKSLPERLPVLGLSDIVVFPGMVTPLLVESAQSIRLIDDVVAGDRFLALVLQRRAEDTHPGPDDLYNCGCAARVVKMLKFPDHTVRVLVEGLRRCRVVKYTAREPYLIAQMEWIDEAQDDSIELKALARTVHLQFQEVINLSPALSEQVKVAAMNSDAPGATADLAASHLNFSLSERQSLLEAGDVKARLTRLLPLLGRELEVLTLGSKIQREVATAMSKSQRDFFLREQIRVIQRELGEGDPGSAEVAALREQIDQAGLTAEAKQVATREVERLQQIPVSAAEYTVARNYLDWLIHLPWSRVTPDTLDLAEASRLFERQHHGLQKVKDRLLEYLAVIKLKGRVKGPILCLVGPPGVGKTSLGQTVAAALGRKFIRISLGGMRDEAEIRGHRRTYVGAMPGRILQSLRRVEVRNPVILLDELDKVGSDFRGDPASALLEVLDPEQNQTFVDHFLEIPFDLSEVLFLTTANWLDPVQPALRDRLEVIELPSYTLEEKLQIARRFLVPRQIEAHGLKGKSLRFGAAALRRVVEDYTREAGVRQLDREIAAITRKVALASTRGGRNQARLTITPDWVAERMGPPRFIHETAESFAEVGIAVGLGWTPVGGDILFIEATRVPGRGNLILTGSLGEVMKESAQAALTYLRSQATALGLPSADQEKWDIHVHVPAGATPKDGPSAGLTIAVALASLLLRRKVRGDVAMTGEISLRGRVLPVGGIKEKVLAAVRAKIRQVILPERNRKDWLEVPPKVRSKLRVHWATEIAEVFPIVLLAK